MFSGVLIMAPSSNAFLDPFKGRNLLHKKWEKDLDGKEFLKGFIWAFLIIIMIHVALDYILLW